MGTKKGNLSIDSENIFPIIKKWVYSDHDIFIRELVSNGCDAITKYKKLDMMGECELPDDYKDTTTEDEMIGPFGLGFQSAFMVADEVQIDTLSYKEGAAAVHWVSEGGTEYEMQEGNRTDVGTEITVYLNEDSLAFSNQYRAREVL